MTDSIFKEGGSHKIRRTGHDQYSMSISIPEDADGRVARECPTDSCSPGYFKVTPGTGITVGHNKAFCPYCRHASHPNDFATSEQIRYAKDLVMREAHSGIEKMLQNALGIGPSGKKKIGGAFLSIEMSYKPGPKPYVRRPFEENLRRDIICPYCGLDQSVFGLAVWCADCGKDIFLTHVKAELSVLKTMLSDVGRRREELGARIAAKDLENSLEDIVSIYEAVIRVLVRRHLSDAGKPQDEIDKIFSKKIGNSFQNVKRAWNIIDALFSMDLYEGLKTEDVDMLAGIFEKRHPITHNLGVVDKKYIENAMNDEREGREVLVSEDEIKFALDLSLRVFESLHKKLFS